MKDNKIKLSIPQALKFCGVLVSATVIVLNYNTRFVSVEKSVRSLDSIQTVAMHNTAKNDKKLDVIVAYLQGRGVMPDKIPEYETCLTVASISDTVVIKKDERITCKNELAKAIK